MQVISQNRRSAVTYRGVSLGADSRGMTTLNILTEGGKVFTMGHFADPGKAESVMEEIIRAAAGENPRNEYSIPGEWEE